MSQAWQRVSALVLCGWVVVWAGAQVVANSPPAIIECVAHAGDPAPGMPGVTLAVTNSARIDGEGNVSFFAFLEGEGVTYDNNMAVFYGPVGDAQCLIRTGDPAPGMPDGVIIDCLYYAAEMLSECGTMVLAPTVAGPGIEAGVNETILLMGPPGDWVKVLQEGDQAPGCEPGETFQSPLGGKLSDEGTLMVGSDLRDPVWPDSFFPDHGLWIAMPGGDLQLVNREGVEVPGLPAGTTLMAHSEPVFNDGGQMVFWGATSGPSRVTREGRWLAAPGSLQYITYDDAPVPDLPEGVIWQDAAGGHSTTNAQGQVTDTGYISGPGVTEDNNYVLVAGTVGDLHVIARKGDAVPEAGPGVHVDFLGPCLVNNLGEMLYRVRYAGEGITDANDHAVYFGPLGAGELMLRDGDPAPTFPAGVVVPSVSDMLFETAMNDVGDMISGTLIEGPGVTEDDDVVLWLWHHVLQRWVPLLRSGDVVGGRVVWAEDVWDLPYIKQTGGADGSEQGFNDLVQLVMRIKFTDGTEGLYRVSPPIFGDGDGDGDADGDDSAMLLGCWTGPGGAASPDCEVFDLDADGDIDLRDQSMLQQLLRP